MDTLAFVQRCFQPIVRLQCHEGSCCTGSVDNHLRTPSEQKATAVGGRLHVERQSLFGKRQRERSSVDCTGLRCGQVKDFLPYPGVPLYRAHQETYTSVLGLLLPICVCAYICTCRYASIWLLSVYTSSTTACGLLCIRVSSVENLKKSPEKKQSDIP